MNSASQVERAVAGCIWLHQLIGALPMKTIQPVVLRCRSDAFQSASQYASSRVPPDFEILNLCESFVLFKYDMVFSNASQWGFP